MKKLFLGALLLLSTLSFGQEKLFSFNGDGETKTLNSEVIIDLENQKASEIYQKTLDFINMTYGRAESVINGKSENNFLKIKGSSDCAISFGWQMTFSKKLYYNVLILIKDNKVKIQIVNLSTDVYGISGMGTSNVSEKLVSQETDLSLEQKWWKTDGSIRKIYKVNQVNIETVLNRDFGALIKTLKEGNTITNNW